jgi:hypothetical protein
MDRGKNELSDSPFVQLPDIFRYVRGKKSQQIKKSRVSQLDYITNEVSHIIVRILFSEHRIC